jgi:hypothetical protein
MVSLYEDSKVIKVELNDLKGSLFDIRSLALKFQ